MWRKAGRFPSERAGSPREARTLHQGCSRAVSRVRRGPTPVPVTEAVARPCRRSGREIRQRQDRAPASPARGPPSWWLISSLLGTKLSSSRATTPGFCFRMRRSRRDPPSAAVGSSGQLFIASRPHRCGDHDRRSARRERLPSRVAGAVARPGSHRTVRTLLVYGSSGRRVVNPAAGRFASSNKNIGDHAISDLPRASVAADLEQTAERPSVRLRAGCGHRLVVLALYCTVARPGCPPPLATFPQTEESPFSGPF